MRMKFNKILKAILGILGIFLLIIILYLMAAFGLSSITVNKDFAPCEKEAVEIYIMTNGVHTDLVLPFNNEMMDWGKMLDPSATHSRNPLVNYVAFGWGDKGFYLDTKTWAELKISTAFNALFYLGTSAMHVTFYKKIQVSESCRKICIDKESYRMLVQYISDSFKLDGAGLAQQIPGAAYWKNDSFYEANRKYSLFYTCNTWANNGLKSANLKACWWTPFDSGIFQQYEN